MYLFIISRHAYNEITIHIYIIKFVYIVAHIQAVVIQYRFRCRRRRRWNYTRVTHTRANAHKYVFFFIKFYCV